MRGSRRQIGALVLVLALGAGLTGCSSSPESVIITQTVPPTIEPDKTPPPEPSPEPEYRWPLTGVLTKAIEPRPALAVKIENSEQARPQEGLEFADMVWEEVVEGGITRFVAVYHSQIPERVLPIRSARPMDAAIVAPLGGILVYSGAQPVFINMINAAGVQSIIMDSGDPGFYRSGGGRVAPHDVAGTMATFLANARADREVPPPPQAAFAAETALSTAHTKGAPVTTLDVRMSGVQRTIWDWDEATGQFQRSDGLAPSMSAAGTRIGATNVILVSVDLINTEWRDPAGNPVPETLLTGEGATVIASAGKAIEGTWHKADTASPMQFLDADGAEVQLAPGNTWLLLVPRATGRWDVFAQTEPEADRAG